MKIVSQLDASGYFIGPVDADESPLEPGVYLIPGGAVDAPLPVVPAGQRAKWVGGGFVLEVVPVEPPPPTVPTSVTNAQGKAALILMGKDTAVETIIDNIVDQTERKLAWNDYNNRLTWERSNARLQAIAALADLDLDELFTLAAQQ